MWPWPWSLTFWPWTLSRLLHDYNLHHILAKTNNLLLSYSDMKIENLRAVSTTDFTVGGFQPSRCNQWPTTHLYTEFQQNPSIRGCVILGEPQRDNASQKWVDKLAPPIFVNICQFEVELLTIRLIFTTSFSMEAILGQLFLRVGRATYIKYGKKMNHWRFQCTFWISDMLLHFEIRAPKTGLRRKSTPNLALFAPYKLGEG